MANKFVEGLESGAGSNIASFGKDMLEQVVKILTETRSVVCIVGNDSEYTLKYSGSYSDHGGLAVTPQDIPPMSAMTFGAQASSNSFMTGAEGHADFVANDRDETKFRVNWDNPWAGDNSGDLTRNPESDERYWTLRHVIGSGNQKAEMRFLITSLPSLRGPIRRMWDELAGFDGFLGAPTTDEAIIPGAPAKSTYVDFDGGSVYYSPATGAWPISDKIREEWLKQGGPGSPFGFPISREHDVPGGRLSQFEHGKIYWNPKYGVYAVTDKEPDQWDDFRAGLLLKFSKLDKVDPWANVVIDEIGHEKIPG